MMGKMVAHVCWLGFGLAALTACVSPQEQYQRDVSQCESYGFTEGTADFSSCLMTMDQQRQMRRTIVESSTPMPVQQPQPFRGPDLTPGLLSQSGIMGPRP